MKSPVPSLDSPAPTISESRAIQRAAERYRDRPEPFAYGDQPKEGDRLTLDGKHNDRAGQLLWALDTFGTASPEFTQHGIGRVAAVMRSRGEKLPNDTALNAGLAAVGGIAPQNETEAMLAVQMVGVHEVAMEMLTRAKLADTTDALERYGALATKLLRTFTAQTETLAKFRRRGEQTVRVEHVHVYSGGQAIVGNVAPGGGGQHDDGHRAHAPGTAPGKPALSAAVGAPLRSPNAGRNAMPVAGRERAEPLQDARGRSRQRRAGG